MGRQGRTGLVRVPLAWGGDVLADMVAHANPGSAEPIPEPTTYIPRPSSSGLATAQPTCSWTGRHGRRGEARLGDPGSLELTERLSTANHDDFEQLPTSCAQSAYEFVAEREMFEADGVPGALIDGLLVGLRDTVDATLVGELAKDEAGREELIRRHWHVR